jgi:hypothetical protein
VDPASRWSVVLERLDVNTTDTSGAAWDVLGGAPDPFVEVRVGSATATPQRSGVGTDTFAVTFSGGATASNLRADSISAYLYFEAWDEDTTSNDSIGRCAYRDISEAVFGGATQTLTCGRDVSTVNAGFTLTWHLERF